MADNTPETSQIPENENEIENNQEQEAPPAPNPPVNLDEAIAQFEQPANAGEDAHDDSGYSSDTYSVLTESVRSSIYDHRYEYGRRFHAYKQGKYFMPNDEPEQERMDMQHRAMYLALGSRLSFAPVNSPQRALDLGCGTGIWAIEFADENPQAEVYGVDLSPIQPGWVPPNVKFEIDDVEDTWTWPQDHFDLIFSRLMISGSIQNLRNYIEQIYRHTAPGGYFESHEIKIEAHNDLKPVPEECPVNLWAKYMREGISKMNRNLAPDLDAIATTMREVGFVDVVVKSFQSPLGLWPEDKELRHAGAVQLVSLLEGLSSISLALFRGCLGWTDVEVEIFLAGYRPPSLSGISN
ncbi:putative methyltransferase type 11 [Phaeomoniella chlamydospora]|uniref:Putative methyltransferase type 11 n=1 Tax=Phaeomoniella chlamydospora TaxID=158046 RepID=A0A0G2E1R9_PHACM|nr:putative methyltransferase type 11 [Phaeomoniella chlamydospora]